MWKPIAVIALFLSFSFAGWRIGLEVGDRVCSDSPNQFLRCLDEDLHGGWIGAVVGLAVALLTSVLLVSRSRKRRSPERHLGERI
jgi:hypothetical protein